MSEIKYSADLDTKKLESAIKQSVKVIKDWAKDVEKAGGQADRGLNKMTKSFKEAIAEQKTLIKSLEQNIKELQKAYNDIAAGQAKSNIGVDLRSARTSLITQNKKLLDLQQQQIEANKQTEKSAGGVIEKIGKMALAYITVTVVVKALKETVLAFFFKSQEGVELLERKISGLKAAVGVLQGEFIKLGKSMIGEKGDESTPWGTRIVKGLKLISTTANFIPGVRKYFDDLATSMNDAADAAEKYTRIEQELEDAERAMIVPRAKANAEIVKARLLYADDTKSPEIRIAALEKALKLENKTAQEEIKHQQWVILNLRDINNEKKKTGQLRDDDLKAMEEAIAKEIELQTESNQRQVRATNSLTAARKELYDAEIEKAKEAFKVLKDEYGKINDILSKIDPGKGFSLLNRSLKRSGKTPATGGEFNKEGEDNFKLSQGSLEWYKKMQKAIKDNDKVQIEALKKELDLRNQIVNAVADLVYQIGEQIGLDEKSMSLLNAGLNAFTALAAGDLVGAAVAMLSGIIAQIPTAASKFEGKIEHINRLLEEQKRLIDLSEQKGRQEEARQKELDYLKQKEALAKAEYERLQASANSHLDLLGWRHKKAKEARQAWEAVTDEIEDSNAALDEFFTDTTAASIADSISQGFQDGKTSAADFADTFNDFMIQAINAALTEMSKPSIAAWYKQFAIDMESGGGLTKDEIADLKIDWDKIIAEGKANREAVSKVTGLSLNTSEAIDNGLSMGIQRNISEATGTELAGLFRRFADDNRTTKDYSLAGLNHLVGIEKNTAETVTQLQLAVSELKNITSNTKQTAVGSF